MSRCLSCYQELEDGQRDFHPRCARKIFESSETPLLLYTKENIAELAKQVVKSQITVTGVQPKLSLDIETIKNTPKRFTIVGLWGRFILKPPTEQYSHLPELEDLTMHLAEIARIATVPHSLIRFADGELCYITRRIDRDKKGNKYPMEDMCQLTERLTELKYKGSHEQIAKAIYKYSAAPKLDVINFWEQVLFSWLTGNADMHLKNFSLYCPVKNYQLTPAYDMVATRLVIPQDTEELALTLNGKKSKLKKSDFEKSFTTTGLEIKVIENIYSKFEKSIPKWLDFIDISFVPKDMKTAYKELIKERWNRLSGE